MSVVFVEFHNEWKTLADRSPVLRIDQEASARKDHENQIRRSQTARYRMRTDHPIGTYQMTFTANWICREVVDVEFN